MSGILEGRAAVITGANQGLGLAIAQAYVAAGAHVLACARDEAKLMAAVGTLAKSARPGQKVVGEAADVSNPTDVARVVTRVHAEFPNVQILVNNAGVHGPLGSIDEADWSEWVRAIEINLFGSVLLCRALLPHFRANRYGKIIQLSGGGATKPMPRITAYAASKAAVVRVAESIAEDVREYGIDVNSVAPGAMNTRLLDEVLSAGPDRVGQAHFALSKRQMQDGGTPPTRAAELAVFLGSAASDGITGKLISAVWDPWPDLPAHRKDLESDVYTLRRIVPKDRGFGWGND